MKKKKRQAESKDEAWAWIEEVIYCSGHLQIHVRRLSCMKPLKHWHLTQSLLLHLSTHSSIFLYSQSSHFVSHNRDGETLLTLSFCTSVPPRCSFISVLKWKACERWYSPFQFVAHPFSDWNWKEMNIFGSRPQISYARLARLLALLVCLYFPSPDSFSCLKGPWL